MNEAIAESRGNWFSAAKLTELADGGLLVQSDGVRIAAWTILLLLLLLIPLALKRAGIKLWPGIIAGFIIMMGILIVPGLPVERVQIAPGTIQVQTGFWFAPTRHDIPLAGVTQVEEVFEQGRRTRRTVWNFRYADGHLHRLVVSDLHEAVKDEATARLAKFGIPLVAGLRIKV